MMLQTVLILMILLEVMVGLENVNENYCPQGEHYKALADRECAKLSLESLIMRLHLPSGCHCARTRVVCGEAAETLHHLPLSSEFHNWRSLQSITITHNQIHHLRYLYSSECP